MGKFSNVLRKSTIFGCHNIHCIILSFSSIVIVLELNSHFEPCASFLKVHSVWMICRLTISCLALAGKSIPYVTIEAPNNFIVEDEGESIVTPSINH